MATKAQTIPTKRLEIPYFDACNASVGANLGKKEEPYFIENARCKTIALLEKREGTKRIGDTILATGNYGLIYFESDNPVSTGLFRISKVSSTVSLYYLNTSDGWQILSGNGTSLTAQQFDHTLAEGCCFLVNGTDANRYITSDGVTVTTSSTSTGHLYGSPIAHRVNYYKDRLYVGDYYVARVSPFSLSPSNSPSTSSSPSRSPSLSPSKSPSLSPSASPSLSPSLSPSVSLSASASPSKSPSKSPSTSPSPSLSPSFSPSLSPSVSPSPASSSSTRYKNGVMFSSTPLGIVALVNGDHAAADCEANDWIQVTDTKYLYATDTVDIYRGNNKIADITIKAKTEDSFQINAITFSGSYTTLNSADEVWVDGTYTGTKVFRWAGNPSSGTDVKQYDTFKITGGQNDSITMLTNIGDVMIIGNKNNLAIWNDYSLKNMDMGIGCTSSKGYIKNLGQLFFVGYNGIYASSGGVPQLISSKIKRYIDGASKLNLESAVVGKQGSSVFFFLGDINLYHNDGSFEKTLSGVVVEWNMQVNGWYIHSNLKISEFRTYIEATNPDTLAFTSFETNNPVFELFKDEVDDSGNNNKEIQMRVDTDNITLSKYFEQICLVQQIIVESEKGSGTKIFISLDDDQWYELGEIQKGCTILKVISKNLDINAPPRCRRIRLSVRDFTKKGAKISRIAIQYVNALDEEEEHN
jgi:hypothetical protein